MSNSKDPFPWGWLVLTLLLAGGLFVGCWYGRREGWIDKADAAGITGIASGIATGLMP